VSEHDLTPEARVELRRRLAWWSVGAGMLLVVIGLFVAYVVVEQQREADDRLVARFVLCRELEALKAAERRTLRARIDDNEDFLQANPQGLPTIGVSAAQIQRGIDRDTQLLESLAAYPDGCAAFARDPSNLLVEVPEVPTQKED
jgi:hypothetical protein